MLCADSVLAVCLLCGVVVAFAGTTTGHTFKREAQRRGQQRMDSDDLSCDSDGIDEMCEKRPRVESSSNDEDEDEDE
eukprot:COSAG05_NODE_17_length_35518_cov_34.728084_5_plen_77_part_00